MGFGESVAILTPLSLKAQSFGSRSSFDSRGRFVGSMLVNQRLCITAVLISSVFYGCALESSRRQSGPRHISYLSPSRRLARSVDSAVVAEMLDASPAVTQTQLVAHQQEVVQPREHSDANISPPLAQAEDHSALALEDLERLAMSNNPTLLQASAQVQAERGAAYQAGLPFNPVIGYTSEQIGANGTAGELQGGFVSQEIVTGGKLRLSREKWTQRAQIAETNQYAQQQRVLNDLRSQYFRTFAAQRVLEIRRNLVANGEDNVQTHREMVNLGQKTASELLQAEVELRRDELNLKMAENEVQSAWRTLAAMAGVPQLAPAALAGSLTTEQEPLDYNTALAQLLSSSPEVTAAWQKIRHDQIAVERERAEPIPNILAEARVGRNYETSDTTAGVNIGLRLPVFDRNRGTIEQAEADLTRANAEAQRLELELQTRLAAAYDTYLSAWQRVQEYQATMLPKAQEAHELLEKSYKDRRATWVDVIAARRFHMTLNMEYVDSLKMYQEANISIRGMMLTGGLTEAPAPLTGGHIDATPKPR